MMRSFITAIITLSLLSACAPGEQKPAAPAEAEWRDRPAVTLVEEVGAGDSDIAIPYRKYRLANGMTVVLHEDDSDPLVHVDVTYHVGSAREEPRRSGFAHFFEHMMFQGSAHVGDDEHFRFITQAGGDMNGTTNSDRTNYFQTIPSNHLETALWLESDRMGFLLEAVTQEKFEVQRSTVKNERGQNVENQPYGRFNEINNAALYPAGHPYSWPTIGYPEDLDAATPGDLKRFFLRWYGPNNATVTIGGDIDREETLQLVQKYFGDIPPGPEVEDAEVQQAELEEDRYVSYVDENIRFPGLLFTWPTVPTGHPDRAALDCLADIFGDGRDSYLYQEFVQTSRAIQADAFHNAMELAGSMTLFVLPYPGTPLDEFEGDMRDLLADFDRDSISEDDVAICRATRESSLLQNLASVQGKASRLAYYQTFFDDPNRLQTELEELRSLRKEDVLRVFDEYVRDEGAVIQSIVSDDNPEGQAQPDNYEIPERPPRTESQTAELEPRPVRDQLDRSQPPEVGDAPLVDVPEFWRTDLESGTPAIGTFSDEVPLVAVDLRFDGGPLLESPEEYGIASLMASMLNEGTENYSAEDFERELDRLGSRITVSASNDDVRVSLVSLSRNLEESLDLLEERLLRSEFTQADLERLRQQQVESIQAEREQPSAIAGNLFRELAYGEGHNLAVPPMGRRQTLQDLELADLRDFRERALATDNLRAVVVGDVAREDMLPHLDFLGQLPEQAAEPRSQPDNPDQGGKLFLVDKPGTAQSEVRIGYLSDLTYDATGEYYRRYLMNYVLGGAFNSRINMNLREDKGYTYGARSGFRATHLPGPFTASASVKQDATADSVRQFIKEIRRYREEGIKPEEMDFMRSAVGQSEALDYETPWQKARFLSRILEYDLSPDFVDERATITENIEAEEIDRLAKRHLPLDEMFILVVGDASATRDDLEALDYPIVELDANGDPI